MNAPLSVRDKNVASAISCIFTVLKRIDSHELQAKT